MSLFQYPKAKHRRRISPRIFKNYRTYKRYLQTEFLRVCVYCRQPDSCAPNLNFGVDHYRPKGIARFASLVCTYENLFYCCGSCNSRKNNDWPLDEKAGPYVVNPCEHEMAKHLWFDGGTGRVDPKTDYGIHTEQLLQLNDDASVQYRLGTLKIVRLLEREIRDLDNQLKAVNSLFQQNKISQSLHNVEVQSITAELALTRDALLRHTGNLPLPPLRKTRLGVSLL